MYCITVRTKWTMLNLIQAWMGVTIAVIMVFWADTYFLHNLYPFLFLVLSSTFLSLKNLQLAASPWIGGRSNYKQKLAFIYHLLTPDRLDTSELP